jgi:hypothetical protein
MSTPTAQENSDKIRRSRAVTGEAVSISKEKIDTAVLFA